MPNPQQVRAAGTAFTAPTGRTLFVKRSADSDHPGEWCFPGGHIEDGETPEDAAVREGHEEIGARPPGERKILSAGNTADGVHFTTFRQRVPHEFAPRLNGEHTAHAWAPMSHPPQPLHPGVRALLSKMAMDRATIARRQVHGGLAFDRASVRSVDRDGRLHVEVTNISKAAVNPYLGREIPDAEALGLDPDQVYQLLRDPAELKKAADTFNNIPLLSEHVPVSAADHRPDLVIGSTGTDAEFVAPYLRNSLVVWAAIAIEGIESGAQRELSCAYRYRADMKPGTYQGERFDGRMVDLVGNHVAVVAAGRAGPDVVVGDSLPTEIEPMKNRAPSRMAILARGALLSVLALDARPKLPTILAGVTASNWKARRPSLLAKITPLLAADADVGHLVKLLDSLDSEGGQAAAPGDDPGEAKPDANLGVDDEDTDDQLDAVDADPIAEVLDMLRGKISDEDLAAVEAKLRPDAATDAVEPPELAEKPAAPGTEGANPGDLPAAPFTSAPPATSEKDDMVSKPAMDAAIKAATAQAVVNGRKLALAINEAEKVVRPYVGELVAQDSAEAVYKAALGVLGVKVDGVHPSAYRAILEAQPKPGAGRPAAVAMDAASAANINTRFPNLARLLG